jgi:lipooligosaccharide transport system permease protein
MGRLAQTGVLAGLSRTLRAVWHREMLLFRQHWIAPTFGALVEPLIYMAGFSLGISQLLDHVDGQPYKYFIGTGMTLTAVLFSAGLGGMYEAYNRRTHQRLYEAFLQYPIGVPELVIAEASWVGVKATTYGCGPFLLTLLLGLQPRIEMLLVPLICLVTGLAFSFFAIWAAAIVPTIDGLQLFVSGVIIPLNITAGVFFPLNHFPPWALTLTELNPLYHAVELVRNSAYNGLGVADLMHCAVLLVFCSFTYLIAVRAMTRRLID